MPDGGDGFGGAGLGVNNRVVGSGLRDTAPTTQSPSPETRQFTPEPQTQHPRLLVLDLGLTPYDEAWSLQKRAAAARIGGALAEDLLILVQHPPVVTLGRSTKPGHLLASAEYLEARGIQVREVERGGDVTIHEPGQLVVYPIIDLKRHRKDLHWYLRQVEEAIMRALLPFDLPTVRVPGQTGVWREDAAGKRKLASIGVHARDWVTWHGVALNVTNDLSTFRYTVPCGIDGVEMSTVARERATMGTEPPTFEAVSSTVIEAFGDVFSLVPEEGWTVDALHAAGMI